MGNEMVKTCRSRREAGKVLLKDCLQDQGSAVNYATNAAAFREEKTTTQSGVWAWKEMKENSQIVIGWMIWESPRRPIIMM